MFSKVYLRVILFWATFWAAGSLVGPAFAERVAKDAPYHITADRLSFDETTQTYEARGRVVITQENRALYADAVDFHVESGEAKAWILDAESVSKSPAVTADPISWDKVYFISGKDRLSGNRIEMNLDTGMGTVYDGHLFIEESHFYIRGDEIQKTGENSYYVKDDVGFTTCDGDSPDWEITGKDLRVTVEGYGTLKHVAFRAKSIPVLYVPYVFFPAKIKRQTGLLVPLLLYSNSNGFEYIQPFFWAINESSDATVYEHYMAHRGFKHGLEYRYLLSAESGGTMMYDFLYDEQIDDGTSSAGSSGYRYEGFREDDVNRLNRKRWWFRTKNDWDFPADVHAKLDLDVVSDQDYLREFDTLYSGYDRSDDYFLETFGRGLDDKTDTVRLNQLYVNKSWNQFSLSGDFSWFDDVIAREHDKPDTSLQELPSITLSASKQRLFDSPLYFDGDSNLNHFWRDVGPRGYTAEVYPRIYYPTTVFRHFDLEPSVGVRETAWWIESGEDDPMHPMDELRSRELFDVEVDLSTEISRVFDVAGGRTDKIRHAIKPEVVYSYIPNVEQDDIPDFVSTVGEERKITYSLTNTFTARQTSKEESVLEPVGGLQAAPPRHTYREFCRFKLSQSYDILEASETPPPGVERRPFSDVSGRLELRPWDAFHLVDNITWNTYSGDVTGHDAVLVVKDGRGDRLSVDYQFEPAATETVQTEVFVKLFHPVSVSWDEEYNLRDKEDVMSTLTVYFEPQCWGLMVRYKDDRISNTREYSFVVSLYGLGEYELGKYEASRTGD